MKELTYSRNVLTTEDLAGPRNESMMRMQGLRKQTKITQQMLKHCDSEVNMNGQSPQITLATTVSGEQYRHLLAQVEHPLLLTVYRWWVWRYTLSSQG